MPPSKDQPWWFRVMERWGFPTLAAAVIAIASWRAVSAVASWVAPRADKVIDSHVETLDRLAVVTETQEKTLSRLEQSSEETSRKVDDIHRAVVRPPVVVGQGPQ